MELQFERLDPTNEQQFIMKEKWGADESINYLFNPCFEATKLPVYPRSMLKVWATEAIDSGKRFDFMIVANNQYIGEVSLVINPEYLYINDGATAWISLVIGEAQYRGKGLGKKAIEFIEQCAKDLGLTRVELGVFEFNTNAIKTYEKMGYTRIAEIKGFTFYKDHWYSDFRYDKFI